VRLRRQVFRALHPRWSVAPASGEGAALHGGRFNPRGMRALYTSLRVETAWLEAQQGFAFKAQPMTICGYEVDCEDVVDLTEAETLSRWGVEPADLGCAWEAAMHRRQEPPSWAIARRLIADGIAGALVPSFAPGCGAGHVNAVFWRWSDALPHRVRAIDDEHRLPRDDASWR
jgi:RES domain-containing protein